MAETKKDLADGKISKAEYTQWNRPKTTDDCGKHEPSKEWRDHKDAIEMELQRSNVMLGSDDGIAVKIPPDYLK